jgi:hypothetical protein
MAIGPFPLHPSEAALRQVHYRSKQVGLERVGIPKIMKATQQANERFLGHVLGKSPVARHDVSESERLAAMGQVELFEPLQTGFLAAGNQGNARTPRTPQEVDEWSLALVTMIKERTSE